MHEQGEYKKYGLPGNQFIIKIINIKKYFNPAWALTQASSSNLKMNITYNGCHTINTFSTTNALNE